VAAVHLSECFLFAQPVTTHKPTLKTSVRPTIKPTLKTSVRPTIKPTTARHTTKRHFAYAAAQETPDVGKMFQLIFDQITKFVSPDAFKTAEGAWRFYYNYVLKVVNENMFRKIVAPVIAQQLKAAGVTKSEDVDSFFSENFEAPMKQVLAMFNQMAGPFIDNFNADDAIKQVNDFIDNVLKPWLNDAITYLGQNKAVIKPHIIDFINNEYAKDAMELLKDLKEMVKKDINA